MLRRSLSSLIACSSPAKDVQGTWVLGDVTLTSSRTIAGSAIVQSIPDANHTAARPSLQRPAGHRHIALLGRDTYVNGVYA